MPKLFLILSALAGGLAVILGAFAAHGLKGRLDPALLAVFRTGVEYQMYHALSLLGVAILMLQRQENSWLLASGALFAVGILLFSGSLYGLALQQWKWLGPVTPIGGLCLIAGWCCLLIAGLRQA